MTIAFQNAVMARHAKYQFQVDNVSPKVDGAVFRTGFVLGGCDFWQHRKRGEAKTRTILGRIKNLISAFRSGSNFLPTWKSGLIGMEKVKR